MKSLKDWLRGLEASLKAAFDVLLSRNADNNLSRWHSVKKSDRGSGIYRWGGRGLRNAFDTTTLIPGHIAFSVSSFSSTHDKSISICILIHFLILILMLCSRSFDVTFFFVCVCVRCV